jgi:hypothetical protein
MSRKLFEPQVDVYEGPPEYPEAVIRLAVSPSGASRRLTVAEAKALIAELQKAVGFAESGAPLPPLPTERSRRRPPQPPEAGAAALPAA